jgi:hypothetical protein
MSTSTGAFADALARVRVDGKLLSGLPPELQPATADDAYATRFGECIACERGRAASLLSS